tara:strand:+ start:552 stop:905 length:354 start_codon:yes stop_codon:yes gene_type:complete
MSAQVGLTSSGPKRGNPPHKRKLILDRVGLWEKIYETLFIIFLIGFIFDSYECTSRKFLVDPSKKYLRNRKNRNEKNASMRGTRQALLKKFGYSSLFVLNWQIEEVSKKFALTEIIG